MKSCLLSLSSQKMEMSLKCPIPGKISSPGHFDACNIVLLNCCVQGCMLEKVFSLSLKTYLMNQKSPRAYYFKTNLVAGFSV